MSESIAAGNWDAEYARGRYAGESPIPFTNTIMATLGEEGKQQLGLYVGCGNGRNYLPLLAAGFNLIGMDISSEAIEQLHAADPSTAEKAFVGDFANHNGANVFDYIVAIQVFQHGDRASVENLMQHTHQALKPGGKLFMRVNSVDTEVKFAHDIVEGNDQMGKTIRYKEGPKRDQNVHFYSKQELARLVAQYAFDILLDPYEVTEQRKPPRQGMWTQWETIWQKQSGEQRENRP